MTTENNPLLARIEEEIRESCRVKERFPAELKQQILRLAEQIAARLRQGGTLYLAGNGGSAADAQHLAAELVGRLRRTRRALPAVALTTNTSILTAVANDGSYDDVFARQVEALVRAGDVLIGISTSGESENVVRALRAAQTLQALTVGWTGESGGRVGSEAALCLRVPSRDTQRIQESHILIGHIVCGLVEDLLEAAPAASK